MRPRTAFRLGLAGTPSGCPCMRPRALTVCTTGASSFSASSRIRSGDLRTPPPARMTGFLAVSSTLAARAIFAVSIACVSCFATVNPSPSNWAPATSSGTSIWLGPGRPDEKFAKARSNEGIRSNPVSIRSEVNATIPAMARWLGNSCRCPLPLPSVERAFTPEITRIGTLSARACPMAVNVFVRPGPVITKATPGRPETRA